MTLNVRLPQEEFLLDAAERAVARAAKALHAQQRDDGHWRFELEADATIPAEFVLLRHFRGEERDAGLERLIAAYLRRNQGDHGGWPLVHGGAFDVSASVKAYFALKTIGDDPQAPHMARARGAILDHGGAAKSNVFTRFLLALFEEIPWSGVPTMPVEIMLLPRWFPFHLDKVSYWARTVLVPLLVLQAIKPRAANPGAVRIAELFIAPPETVRKWPTGAHQHWAWVGLFGAIDRALKLGEPLFPAASRRRAIEAAVSFAKERLNGDVGLGGIYPAMANAVLMFDALGYPKDDPFLVQARRSLDKLLVVRDDEAYCQPCLSPVWDTALAVHALFEAGDGESRRQARRGLEWLKPLQVLEVAGDWAAQRPNARPGGWAFQYANPHYPDLDDTAVVAMAMDRADREVPRTDGENYAESIARAQRMGGRAAERGRRLGGIRRRQRLSLSQQYSVRRSRSPARPADRRRHRPLRFDAGATGRTTRREPCVEMRGRSAPPLSGGGRQLVRALGHELHLWLLVGALRSSRGRHGSAVGAGAPRGRLVCGNPKSGRRMGRERR